MAKKAKFKDFLINHGEKVVVGIVGLLALWGLAGTTWSSPDLERVPDPGELMSNAEKTTSQIESNDWPEEEQEKFAQTPDVVKLASDIGAGDLEYERFAMPVVWNEPLNGIRAKRKQMVVLAPVDPEVSAVTVPIAMRIEEDEEEEDSEEEKPEEEKEEVDEELEKIRKEFGLGEDPNNLAGAFGPGGMAGMGLGGRNAGFLQAMGLDDMEDIGMSMMGNRRGDRDDGRGRGRSAGRGRRGELDPDDMAEMMEAMADGGMRGLGSRMGLGRGAASLLPTAERKVEWHAGVSVRMIVDLRKQRQEVSKALHVKGVQQTQQFIEYQQMHVQRQEQRDGVWPADDEWEEVKLEDLGKILEESLGLDIDPVSPAVTRAEITMPLPRRGAGEWPDSDVSHTRVYDFTLSAEEREMMNKMNAIIAQRAEEAKQNLPPERKERKGFDQYVGDVGMMGSMALRGRYGGSRDAMRNDIMDVMRGAMGELADEEDGRGGPSRERRLTSRQESFINRQLDEINPDDATAVDRLLLVRFIDFTAERGKTYRYRVRLEMRNPNYGAPVDQLEQPEYATTDTIVSEWSDVTAAVEVPMSYHIYVSKFDSRRRIAQLPTYIESDGALPAFDTLDVYLGMPIGGTRKQDRVDLQEERLESGEVNYKTPEVLCAAIDLERPNDSDHPDLAEELRQLPRRDQPAGDLVCVVDHNGDLVLRAAGDRPNEERRDKLIVSTILKEYESWRDGGEDELLEQFGRGGLGTMMGEMGMRQGNVMGLFGDEEDGSGRGRRRGRDDEGGRGGRRGGGSR